MQCGPSGNLRVCRVSARAGPAGRNAQTFEAPEALQTGSLPCPAGSPCPDCTVPFGGCCHCRDSDTGPRRGENRTALHRRGRLARGRGLSDRIPPLEGGMPGKSRFLRESRPPVRGPGLANGRPHGRIWGAQKRVPRVRDRAIRLLSMALRWESASARHWG